MQFFTGKNSWPPDRSVASVKRKHEGSASLLAGKGSKKFKAEDGGVNKNNNDHQDLEDSLHSPSSIDPPLSLIARNSLPSPSVHSENSQPFTRAHVSHTPTSKVYPPSPLSRSLEHTSNVSAAEELECRWTFDNSITQTQIESPKAY